MKHQQWETGVAPSNPSYFHLVKRLTYPKLDNGRAEVLPNRLYQCWNNLTGELRMIRGEVMIEWFKEIAGSTLVNHVLARFSISPIYEDTRN